MKSVRLLIVDDDDSMRMVCRRFFESAPPPGGIEVTIARSGEEALDLLHANDYDCILSDYRMGAVTGLDVLAFAMAHRPATIRIMMSGFASDDLMKSADIHASVHAFIEKPMTTAELRQLLREVVLERYLVPLASVHP